RPAEEHAKHEARDYIIGQPLGHDRSPLSGRRQPIVAPRSSRGRQRTTGSCGVVVVVVGRRGTRRRIGVVPVVRGGCVVPGTLVAGGRLLFGEAGVSLVPGVRGGRVGLLGRRGRSGRLLMMPPITTGTSMCGRGRLCRSAGRSEGRRGGVASMRRGRR